MTWPTMRMLKSLNDGWKDATQQSAVAREAWSELPPLDQLKHSAVDICADFDSNPSSSRYKIHDAATKKAKYKVWEARETATGAIWRTAIIKRGVESWSVFAAYHDKFHSSVADAFSAQRRPQTEPTELDEALRKIKTIEADAAAAIRDWQGELVATVLTLFVEAFASDDEVCVALPTPPASIVPEDDRSDPHELRLVVLRDSDPARAAEAELLITFTLGNPDQDIRDLILSTVLPVLDPNAETWSRDAYYSRDGVNLSIPFAVSQMRASQLIFAAENVDGEAGIAPEGAIQPTTFSHYATRTEITASAIERAPMRAVCGLWFVSTRSPENLPVCPECERQVDDASAVRSILNQD